MTVLASCYVCNFSIAITFSSAIIRIVNFLPLFEKFVKGGSLKYFAPVSFKKFIVNNGNIYWGRNEDIIFPVDILLKGSVTDAIPDEILYVI